jgi:arylsulfatase A-like enzyme
MLIRNFLVATWSLALWVPAAEKPNILFIFTDDQAIFTVSSSGHPYAKTPHMDRRAREGANRVNSFTVTPVIRPRRRT